MPFQKSLEWVRGSWEVLLKQINHQLTQHGVLVKQGAMVDASVPPPVSLYVGLMKTHDQHVLEALAYKLYSRVLTIISRASLVFGKA